MYLQNKYTTWYYNIINSAKLRADPTEYFEQHHIIPKSLGGSNNKDNLVKLTAREHFICHWLLTKMVLNKKHKYQMWNAFSSMLYWHNEKQERIKVTPVKYQIIKSRLAAEKSVRFSGKNNPMFGKHHSKESKEKMSKSQKGRIVSESTRTKISKIHKGKVVSETTREKFKGTNNANYKPGVREKMIKTFEERYGPGVTNPSQIPYICKNCNKSGKGIGNYQRWHGDNCKSIR
jgi:hypothetical protein